MSLKVDIPWHRYATIAELAKRVQQLRRPGSLGKTALQKLAYLLVEWKNVPLGYNFELYNYGPFSSSLMGDLDFVDSLRGVSVKWDDEAGYSITPGEAAEAITEMARAFIDTYSSDIDEVIAAFGQYNATDLELRSTILFAFREMQADSTSVARSALVERVLGLKPKFTRRGIGRAVDELAGLGLVTLAEEGP